MRSRAERRSEPNRAPSYGRRAPSLSAGPGAAVDFVDDSENNGEVKAMTIGGTWLGSELVSV